LRRNPPWSSHIPQHGDQRGSLFHNRHNRLGLDGAILEGINNGLLDFDLGAASRTNRARVWNGNVAVDVYGLRWDRNKITGANTSLGGDEQSPRTCLKNCRADNVPRSEIPNSIGFL
jgi:hypothetical protein